MPRKPEEKPVPAERKSRGASDLERYLEQLHAQRAELDVRIQAIQTAIRDLGGSVPSGMNAGSGRAMGGGAMGGGATGAADRDGGPRAGSLKDFIRRVLANDGDVMAVKDITEGVVKSGYKTRNQTLAKSVGVALTEMDEVEKVGRGRFRLK